MYRRLSIAVATSCFVALCVACGGDGGNKTSNSAQTIAAKTPATVAATSIVVDTKTSPTLSAPASRFSILLDDVGKSFITDIPATFVLDTKSYAITKSFTSPAEGEKLLQQWGYLGGYETGLQPEGREVSVLNGSYYVSVETHMFSSEDGAKQAYTYFEKIISAQSQPVSSDPVGNESSAWTLLQGKVSTSSVDAIFHRIIFRRGNLVAVVVTWGAQPFMTVDPVYRLATIIDQKALNKLPAVEPTPTSNFATPTLAPKTPAAASATAGTR